MEDAGAPFRFIIGLYMALLLDLATLSAKFSAYVLVVINTLPEPRLER